MYHARAHNLQPFPIKLDVHFQSRLNKRKITRAEADINSFSEKLPEKFTNYVLEISQIHMLAHHQSLNLVKINFVRSVGGFVTENSPGHDNLKRRFMLFQIADLHWAGVSAK